MLDEHTKSKYREQQQLAQDIYYEKYRKYIAEKEKEKELVSVGLMEEVSTGDNPKSRSSLRLTRITSPSSGQVLERFPC